MADPWREFVAELGAALAAEFCGHCRQYRPCRCIGDQPPAPAPAEPEWPAALLGDPCWCASPPSPHRWSPRPAGACPPGRPARPPVATA